MSQGSRIDQFNQLKAFDMDRVLDQIRTGHGEQNVQEAQETARNPQTPSHVQKYHEWVGADGYINRPHGLVLNEHLFGRAGDGSLTVQQPQDLGQSNGSNHPGSRRGPNVRGPQETKRGVSARLGTGGYSVTSGQPGKVGHAELLPWDRVIMGSGNGPTDPETWYDHNEAKMRDLRNGVNRSPSTEVVVAALEATQTDAVVSKPTPEDVLAQGPVSKEATQVDSSFRSIFDKMGDEILIERGEHGLPTGFVQKLEQEYTKTFAGTPRSQGKGFFGRLFA